ncbi:MAG: TonB-dependent receptor plug domain-containing protein [Bacteroidota bacterium]
MRNKISWSLLLLLSICTFTYGQSDSIQKSITLDGVIITVNKTTEKIKNVSQEVKVFTKENIESCNPASSADLLFQKGLQVQMSQQGGGSPTLRGFEASRIVLMIDGVRMNNLIYRAGHLQDIIKTDVNLLDRVEVLYGPSSTIYGSDALGGVINLITKNALFASTDNKKEFHVSFLSKYASANSGITNHLDVNYGTNNFASLTSFSISQFGDLMGGKNQNPFYNGTYGERPYYVETVNGVDSIMKNPNRYRQVGTAYHQIDFIQKFSWKQNSNTTQDLNFQYSTTNDVPRYDRLTDMSGGNLKYAEWYYGPQTRMMLAYSMNHVNQNRWAQLYHVGLSYQSLEESRHSRSYKGSTRNNRIENVGVVGFDVYAQHSSEKSKLIIGVDGQMNSLKSTANKVNIISGTSSPLDTRYPDGDNSMNYIGLYLSHTTSLSSTTTLIDGVRVGYSALKSTLVDTALMFHLPYTSIEQTSPVYSASMGIVNRPSDATKLSFTIASGYRVPNVDDLSKIFGSSPGNVIVPNKELKPEQTINYELGFTRIVNEKTSIENYLFYTSVKNIAVVDKYTFNGKDSIDYDGTLSQVMANQNKQQAYIYGISSNLTTLLDNHFTLQTGFNYTYGRIKTDSVDSPLDHIPPFQARMSLKYQTEKFSSLFYANYNGSKQLKDYFLNGEDNEQYATSTGMPAWCTLNLSVSYKIHKNINLNFAIENLLDTQYRVFASGMNAAGRNFILSLRGNF